jgi:hypothetical protein
MTKYLKENPDSLKSNYIFTPFLGSGRKGLVTVKELVLNGVLFYDISKILKI